MLSKENIWQFIKIESSYYIYTVYIYSGRKSKRQTQWVWRQASERLVFNRNNKNKVSKGENSVQNKQIDAARIFCLTRGPTRSWSNGDAQCCQLSNIADPFSDFFSLQKKHRNLVSENHWYCRASARSCSPSAHTHTSLSLSLCASALFSTRTPLSLSPLSLSLCASALFSTRTPLSLSLSLSLCVSALFSGAHLSLSLSVRLLCSARAHLSLSLSVWSALFSTCTPLSHSLSVRLLCSAHARLSLSLSLSLSLHLLSFSSAFGREEQRFNSVKHRYYVASLILHASIAEITAQLLSLSYVYLISSDNGAIIMIFCAD